MARHEDLSRRISEFVAERDWEQFHSPKNLSMALTVEAAELLEHFQWLTQEESRHLPAPKRDQVAEELADVFIYLVRLADRLEIDLYAAAERKLAVNEANYPIDLAKGNARKYTEFDR